MQIRHIKASALSLLSFFLLAATILPSCGGQKSSETARKSVSALPDTLKVVTLYGPTSYFLYRDEPMGYDYTLVDSLAKQKGMVLDLKVAKNLRP